MNKYLPLYSGFQLYLILLIITNACSSNSELKTLTVFLRSFASTEKKVSCWALITDGFITVPFDCCCQ